MEYFQLGENIERHELNIVVIGSFNPVIITPFWLSGKSLIRESDAKSAIVRIMHNEIVDYDLDWVTINITQKRFQLHCVKEPFFELTRDLVVGILNFLKETPISSFGYNHNKHISLKTRERYYEFGNRLCPLKNWNEYLDEPRLNRLEILEKDSKQKPEGSILVTIVPVPEKDINFGVAININDHYNFSLDKDDKNFSPPYILEYWENSLNITNNILTKLSNTLQL